MALAAGSMTLEDPLPSATEAYGDPLPATKRWELRHDWAVDTMLLARYELIKLIGMHLNTAGVWPTSTENPDPDLPGGE